MTAQSGQYLTAGGLAVFVLTYIGLGMGRLPGLRVDRTGVAIIGATLTVVVGALPAGQASAAIDFPTLALLFGMMIVAAYLRLSGFFDLAAVVAVRRATTPAGLLALVVVTAGVLSALFVNDVVCVVLTPVVLELTRRLRLSPVPYVIALAMAANVGSLATLTGNPQNMLVGGISGIPYNAFFVREGPIAAIGLVVVYVVVRRVYREALHAGERFAPLSMDAPVHPGLMTKTLVAVAVMIGAFAAGLPIAVVAMAGAAYSLLTRRVKPEKIYRQIDWRLLVMFAGLFVVVGGVEANPLAERAFAWAAGADLQQPAILTALVASLSNIVSNVPAVLMLKPLIPGFAHPSQGWLLAAMASTLAGNLTVVGSAANLIVVESARLGGVKVGYREYARTGIPVALVTLTAGVILLSLWPAA